MTRLEEIDEARHRVIQALLASDSVTVTDGCNISVSPLVKMEVSYHDAVLVLGAARFLVGLERALSEREREDPSRVAAVTRSVLVSNIEESV